MAERRMLHRAASTSPDLTWLRTKHGPDAALFAILLIPYYDRWGCVAADPGRLRTLVVPAYGDITTTDVKRWTDAMVRRGMLERVTSPDGEKGLRNPSFHDHQAGVQWEREAVSPWEPKGVTDQWRRKPRKTNAETARTAAAKQKGARKQGGHRPVSDQSKSGLVEGKGSKTFPPLPPTGDPAETETPPEGGHHRLAPRPDDHHDTATPNGNGHRHNDDLATAADVLQAMLERQDA